MGKLINSCVDCKHSPLSKNVAVFTDPLKVQKVRKRTHHQLISQEGKCEQIPARKQTNIFIHEGIGIHGRQSQSSSVQK